MDNLVEIRGFRGNYGFLSNFYPCQISYNGFSFSSVEAAFQATKCADPSECVKFQYLSAAEAKKAGRRVSLRSDWD